MQKETLNMDIAGLTTRMNRFIAEAIKCQSANAATVMEHDLRRLKSYLKASDTYKAWVMNQPQLDCPETHPTQRSVNVHELATVENIENESIKDWGRIMQTAIMEMLDSQSSRMASGLVSHDGQRYDQFSLKLHAFIADYIEVELPIDLPETIPSFEGVTAGQTGI